MKIGYIVLAYKNPDQLCRLIQKLINKDSTFYLHIDKKSNISEFKNELSKLNNSTKINLLPSTWSIWQWVFTFLTSFSELSLIKSIMACFSEGS